MAPYLESNWFDTAGKNIVRAQRLLSNDAGRVFLDAIVSAKKIIKEKFFSFVLLNRYNSAPVGQIWTKNIWA
ncbi:hypothetical protein V1477_000095 [Vespula maculifrons]|uniref:Uncharacterized protein n=1 Tax=Vespula maculifrons TaxID=7453 RepID=A0ABD2D3I0_VESMC